MIGCLWLAAYLAVVVLLAGRATGAGWTVRAEHPQRGWFPGGEEDEPEPDPQPEQAVRVPSWARL